MATTNKVLQNTNSRVFLIEGRAGPENTASYESCLRMAGLSQAYGDITRVECPDPYSYGKFVEVAQIRGASERATTTLEGRYMVDVLSQLLKFARQGCAVDVQLHIGTCTDPSEFDTWEKAIIMEEVFVTNYGTEDLGVLGSGDAAVVNETADVSAKDVYELRKLSFSAVADSLITNEIVDIVIADTRSCGGDCDTESSGCKKIFAISKAAGGSATTPADILFTVDGGTTWYARDIDTLSAAEEPSAIDSVGSYIVVVSNATGSFHYALRSYLDGVHTATWTETAITGGRPNAISSLGNVAFIVGDSGYVYRMTNPTATLTTVESGSATSDKLKAVYAYSSDYAVAVGENGAVIYTTTGTTWTAATTRPVGVGVNLNTVYMRSKTEWWVGTSTGRVYYTKNSGFSWTEKTFSGSGSGVVWGIDFATPSVGYISHATAGNVGRLLRTYNGGNTWVVLPEDTTSLPSNQRLTAIDACAFDANFVVGGGLGLATDGKIIIGKAT